MCVCVFVCVCVCVWLITQSPRETTPFVGLFSLSLSLCLPPPSRATYIARPLLSNIVHTSAGVGRRRRRGPGRQTARGRCCRRAGRRRHHFCDQRGIYAIFYAPSAMGVCPGASTTPLPPCPLVCRQDIVEYATTAMCALSVGCGARKRRLVRVVCMLSLTSPQGPW